MEGDELLEELISISAIDSIVEVGKRCWPTEILLLLASHVHKEAVLTARR